MTTATSPTLRWLVDLVVLLGNLMAVVWAIAMVFSGLGMGWGGRSALHVALTVALLLLLPVVASIVIGRRASRAAKQGRAWLSIGLAVRGMLCTPFAWLLAKLGLFSS